MPRGGLRLIWEIAKCKRFRFHFQVDFGIDMSGVQGDMSQPGPNGIDVHTRTEHMNPAGVSQGMRADGLGRERRQRLTCVYNRTMDESIDTEPCQRLIDSVKEHEVLAGMSGNERF